MHQCLISLLSLSPLKYLEFCFSKGILLDTTILLISILFIKIGPLY